MSEVNNISKFVVYTTEDNLIRLCSEKENSWYKIIMKIKEVVVFTKNGDNWDTTNKLLQTLHRAGVSICTGDNDFINQIATNHPEYVLEDPCAAYLLDIDKEKAEKIQNKYGVICQPQTDNSNILVQKGWDIDTAVCAQEQKSWQSFFAGHNCPLNSLVIIDRYFFSSEAGETIEYSLHNLRKILDALLPASCPDNVIQISLVFDFKTLNQNIDGRNYSLRNLAEDVNRVKRKVREYAYTLELLSIDSDCYNYKDTHNRRIIANFSITYALHKLKAFYEGDKSLSDQNIIFNRLFDKGLDDGDKSTTPAASQKDILDKIKDIISTSKSTIEYACNGRVFATNTFEIQNRLLK